MINAQKLNRFAVPAFAVAGATAIVAAAFTSTVAKGINYCSLLNGTQTLKTGDVAAVYGSSSGKEKVDLYDKTFQACASDNVFIYSTSEQPIDQTVHFAAGNITGTLNLQTIVQFEPSQGSIGTIAKKYRVDENTFKSRILASAIQEAAIKVSAKLDPATFNSNIPTVATKIQEVLQQEYGKMIKISAVRITGVADFGDNFQKEIANRTNLKLATTKELSTLKLVQAQRAALEAAQPKPISIYTTTPIVVAPAHKSQK